MRRFGFLCLTTLWLAVIGCRSHDEHLVFDSPDSYVPYIQEIEYPDAEMCLDDNINFAQTQAPPTVRHVEQQEKWPLTLQEAVQLALANSEVIRDLGGRVVSAPGGVSTIYDPAIRETNVERALSSFDAQLGSQLFFQTNDRVFNNLFIGGGAVSLLSNNASFNLAIDKTAATGTQFRLENQTDYQNNTSLANLFSSTYDTYMQATVRHPLMQGGGVEFNRIAGPNATAGNYNGVVLARIDTDVSLADFEFNVRNLLRDVEQTYWELFHSYRDYQAKVVGRDQALETWENEKRRRDVGTGTYLQIAVARQQYYLAQVSVENALSGGTLGSSGIYAQERNLRALLGLPASDGRVIVPIDEPSLADTRFDWDESLAYALTRRVELRRQKWTVKRRELELVAARNFEKMRVDFVGQYRWRGFGDNLIGSRNRPFGNAVDNLLDGDLQDWFMGFEVSSPVGNRVGHAAVRAAELQLSRERALHEEMERQISLELRSAFTELDRAYAVSRSQYNRRTASFLRWQGQKTLWQGGKERIEFVFDALTQAVEADSAYYRAVVDFNQALMNMHLSRGTLLDHYGVRLVEGPWSAEAHHSASKLARKFRRKHLNYCLVTPCDVSLGPYPQYVDESNAELVPLPDPSAPEGEAAVPEAPAPIDPVPLDPASFNAQAAGIQ